MNAFKLFANIVENCTNIVKVFFCKYLTTSKNFWNNFDILSVCLYPHPLGWANSFLSFLEPKMASKSKDFNNNNWDENKDVGNIDRSNTVPVVLKPRDKYYKEDPTNVNIGCSAVYRENRPNFWCFWISTTSIFLLMTESSVSSH